MKEKDFYKVLVNEATYGYALNEFILNKNGDPIDYKVIEINSSYEKLTGLSAKKIIGKNITKIFKGINNTALFNIYWDVVKTGKDKKIFYFFEPLNKHYEIRIYKVKKNCFVTIFDDIDKKTKENNLLKRNQTQQAIIDYSFKISEIPYDKLYSFILTQAKKIFNVKYAWLNKYNEKNNEIQCIASTFSDNENNKITKLFGRQLIGFNIPMNSLQYNEILKLKTGYNKTLFEVAFSTIPKNICNLIEKEFQFGYLQCISIIFDKKLWGTLILAEHKKQDFIHNIELLSFSTITVNSIIRKQTEVELLEVKELAEKKDKEEKYLRSANEELLTLNKKIEDQKNLIQQKAEDLIKISQLHEIIIFFSTIFLKTTTKQLKNQIKKSLVTIAKFAKIERAYILEFDFSNNTTNITCEYSTKELQNKFDTSQNISLDLFPDWIEQYHQGKPYYIHDISMLPQNSDLRKLLKKRGVKSLITMPLMLKQRCVGFVGLESVSLYRKWNIFENSLLSIYSKLISNVMERQQTMMALQESEDKFKTLYNSSEDAYLLLDESRYVDCNKAALSLFGCKSKDFFCSQRLSDLSPYQQADGSNSMTIATKKIKTAYKKGFARFEWLHKKLDTGELFPTEVLLNAIKINNKKVIQVVIRDDSLRRQKELFQDLSSELLRIINSGNNTFDAITSIVKTIKDKTKIDAIGIYLLENDINSPYYYQEGFSDVFFQTKNTLNSWVKPFFSNKMNFWTNNLLSLSEREKLKSPIDESLKYYIEESYNSLAFLPIRGDNKIIGLIQLCHKGKNFFTKELIDLFEAITSNMGIALLRKLAEESLHFQLSFQNLVVEISSGFVSANNAFLDNNIKNALAKIGGFFSVDRSYIYMFHKNNIMENTIEWINKEVKLPTDRDRKYSMSKMPWLCNQVKKKKPVYITDVLNLPRNADAEKEIFIHQGIQSILALPLINETYVIGFLGFDSVKTTRTWTHEQISLLSVVSELISGAINRRKIEETLKIAKHQADLANKAKSTFLSSMSHEIRTPLNGVIGFTDLLMDVKLPQAYKKYVSYANISARSLLEVINSILDLSKIESGTFSLNITKTDIIELMGQAVDITKYAAYKKNLKLLLNIPADTPRYAQLDPARTLQVIINLLSNAIKFTEKGEVELSIKTIPDSGKIFFSIRDTGIGISENARKRIFDSFYQVNISMPKNVEGTGLGLFISNMLVNKMGGSIKVKSKPGEGSTFSFSINTSIENIPAFKKDSLSGINRILVVGGNDRNFIILKETLQYWNIKSDFVLNEQKAFLILKKNNYETIIIDYDLPEMSGINTIIKIRENKELLVNDTTSFILMYNINKKDDILSNLNTLRKVYLLDKPIKINNLYDTLLSHVNETHQEHEENQESVSPEETLTFKIKKETRHKILIVEDVKVNILLIESVLSKILPSAQQIQAHNGEEAIIQYQKHCPDIILMDLNMPIMDGYNATKKIRKLETINKKHTTIIALTAHALANDREKALKAGMDDYLSKPFTYESLKDILEKYLFLKKTNDTVIELTHNENDHFNKDLLLKYNGDDKELILELFELFFKSMDDYISAIKEAINNNNEKELHFNAHTIKGSARMLGFNVLANHAACLELMEISDNIKIIETIEKIEKENEDLKLLTENF